MAQLNVNIDDEAMIAAKVGAARDGMLLRKWVERALIEYRPPTKPEKEKPE